MGSKGAKTRFFLSLATTILLILLIILKLNIINISWNKLEEVLIFAVIGLLLIIGGYSFINAKSRQWWLDRVNPGNTNNPMTLRPDDIKLGYLLGGWVCIIIGVLFMLVVYWVLVRK